MTEQVKHLYGFGPFQLDPVQRLLFREGAVVSLTPKAWDTLLALVENHGRVVSKDELRSDPRFDNLLRRVGVLQ